MASNVELLRYYPKVFLDFVYENGDDFTISMSENGCRVEALTAKALAMLESNTYSEQDRAISAMEYKCMYRMMKEGPIIIRPQLNVCHAMAQTEIKIPVEDFKMPYSIMGVELNQEIIGPLGPALMVVWKVGPSDVLIWGMSPKNMICYHSLLNRRDTIEGWLGELVSDYDKDEHAFLRVGGRIACNLIMLASQRQTTLTPLSPRTAKHRRGNDERLLRLAARECQELIFRDLFIRKSPSKSGEVIPLGYTQEAQHRRGHWKNQPHGPRNSLRKYLFVNDYWTKKEEGPHQQTIILTEKTI